MLLGRMVMTATLLEYPGSVDWERNDQKRPPSVPIANACAFPWYFYIVAPAVNLPPKPYTMECCSWCRAVLDKESRDRDGLTDVPDPSVGRRRRCSGDDDDGCLSAADAALLYYSSSEVKDIVETNFKMV
jgi:hypothetical protein